MIAKIVSGGQTGVDRAALDVAIELGVPHGGWIAKGRMTEEGRLPERYHLQETTSIDYAQRTELNVVDSDGTLMLSHGKPTGGSALTQELARKHRRPCLHVDLSDTGDSKAIGIISTWIDARGIKTLNVAGPRASEDPTIYGITKRILKSVMARYLPKTLQEAVERLVSELSLKDKTAMARMGKDGLPTLYASLGGYIQRRFGLWSGNPELMASCRFASGNKDLNEAEASVHIIKELWKRLRETHGLTVVDK
jgi:hypothetical protein